MQANKNLHRVREIEDLLSTLGVLSRHLCQNGDHKRVQMVSDEIQIGFLRRPPENTYQGKLDEEEFFLTYAEAKTSLLEQIRDLCDKPIKKVKHESRASN